MENIKIAHKGNNKCNHDWTYKNNVQMLIVNNTLKFVYIRKCNKCDQTEEIDSNNFIL